MDKSKTTKTKTVKSAEDQEKQEKSKKARITHQRVNIRVSDSVKEFYENMASESGSTMSSCMSIVLKMHADAVKTVDKTKDFKDFFTQLIAEQMTK